MKLSLLTSRLFEPMIVISLLVVVAAIRAGVGYWFLIFVFFVMVVPALVLRIWYVKKRHVDWDIGERKKRILPLAMLLVIIALDAFLVSLWRNEFLTNLFLLFFVWGIFYFLITLFWKISGHTSVATLAALFLFDWYGFWPIFLTIPVVAWARVVGKNHTIGQSLGGIVYSSLLHEVWKSILR